jgi:hypothetical protein
VPLSESCPGVMDKNLVHFIIERLGFDVLKRVLTPQSMLRERRISKMDKE